MFSEAGDTMAIQEVTVARVSRRQCAAVVRHAIVAARARVTGNQLQRKLIRRTTKLLRDPLREPIWVMRYIRLN